MNVIIMGCGRTGSSVATFLDAEGHRVTIVDTDSSRLERLPQSFGGIALHGDGTSVDFLKRAGIEEADVFVALTHDDNRNIMAAQVAKRIFAVPKVICRIYDPLREELYRSLGMETISPTRLGDQLIRDSILE